VLLFVCDEILGMLSAVCVSPPLCLCCVVVVVVVVVLGMVKTYVSYPRCISRIFVEEL
jgi:hypothetical protein